jgi:hypothetical protein
VTVGKSWTGYVRDEGLNEVVPMTFGARAELSDKTPATLSVRSDWPLSDVRVIVFCDLERVRVEGIFAGVDILTGSIGDAPTAYAKRVEPGVYIRAIVSLR